MQIEVSRSIPKVVSSVDCHPWRNTVTEYLTLKN